MNDSDLTLQPVAPTPLQAKHQPETRQFHGIPGIERNPSGRLWATWYGGGGDEGPDNYVILATSVEGGETWLEELVVDPPADVRAYDPAL